MKDFEICFYHSADLDGICSGAIVHRAYPDCELVGINYGDSFDWSRVQGKRVCMVDFSLPTADMLRLDKEAESLYWYDHHKSAMVPEVIGILGCRDVARAGCEIIWDELYSPPGTFPGGVPGIPQPRSVYLLGRYDVWEHQDPRTVPFQYAARSHKLTTTCDAMQELLEGRQTSDDVVRDWVSEGRAIVRHVETSDAKVMEYAAYELDFEGYQAVIINQPRASSDAFKSVFKSGKHDIMAAYHFNGSKWRVSLRSPKGGVDVSELAKGHGGGGHHNAAGFETDEFLFYPF